MAAKIMADLALKISTDAAELNRGVEQVKTKLGTLKGAFDTLGSGVEKVMGAIGGALGGVVGTITEMGEKLVAATGPVGILVAAIGSIAMAWKEAKEGIEDYLKEADRVKYGAGAFNQEAGSARKETGKRASSGILEGQLLIQQAKELLLLKKYTGDAEKKALEEQIKTGQKMVEDNQRILVQVGEMGNGQRALLGNIKDQTTWRLKYSELLKQQEELDENKIKNDTEIKDLQAKLFEIKTKIAQTSDPVEKSKLQVQYEQTANDIYNKRIDLIVQTRDITGGLLKMTAKDHEFKLLGLKLDNDVAAAEKEHEKNLFKAEAIELKINKAKEKTVLTAEELLRIQKEINTHTEAGYKIEPLKGLGDTQALKNSMGPLGFTGIDTTKLATMHDAIIPVNDAFEITMRTVNKLENALGSLGTAFGNLVAGAQGAGKEMLMAVLQSAQGIIAAYEAEAIAAQVAKTAAIPGIGMFLIAPAVAALVALMGTLIPSFATGTSYAPGGLSLVGEQGPELVNLPRGSQVYTNNQSKNMMGGGNINITVDGKISGRDLALVLRRAENNN